MKKYLLGLFAIALAVGFSSFVNAPAKKTTTTSLLFRFIGLDRTSQAQVQDKDNWEFVAEYTGSNQSCSNSINACEIEVDPAYTDFSTNPSSPVLLDDISASAVGTPVEQDAVIQGFNKN